MITQEEIEQYKDLYARLRDKAYEKMVENDYCVYYPIDVVEQIAKRYCYSTFLEKM